MDGTKHWYESQTVWASVMTVVSGLAVTFGMMTQEIAVAVVGELPGYVAGLAIAVAGMWSLWGRVTATKEID